MEYTELSDVEEGEILEYDSVSPSDTGGAHFGFGNFSLEGLKKESRDERYGLKEKGHVYPGQGHDGYTNQRLKEKLRLNEKLGRNNLNISMVDLESISSDGEYRSDEENKNSVVENKYFTYNNAVNKVKGAFYGTVEDIMSEIGETICRKSRCNYKKRKSKDLKQSLDKCSATSYDLWRREIFFCRLKSKSRKRKGSFSDSNSDLPKGRTEKRKRRKKKREVHYEDDETDVKKTNVRDFDEVRRSLLEKLKKQKADEDSKASTNYATQETENSEIQEVDMLVDCTNYVDEVRSTAPDGMTEEPEAVKEKEGEDELDLVKLRLIALASNKKRKSEEEVQKTEKSESFTPGKKFINGDRKDTDLDRNELLLRAEALKSALLKKHQKRLSKLKVKKPCEIPRNNVVDLTYSPAENGAKCPQARTTNTNEAEHTVGSDGHKSANAEGESGSSNLSTYTSPPGINENKNEAIHQLSHVNGKRSHQKARGKRRKSKSCSFGNNLKENNEKSENVEEDDLTLRSQLLSDLMKKKSLKNLEKKSVLTDSAQTTVNKTSPPVVCGEPAKEHTKPPPAVKTNVPRKINAAKTAKPAALLKIPKPEIQRIIVHLGSEDSSDEDETPPQAEGEGGEATSAPEEEKGSSKSGVKKSSGVEKEADKIRADYERSVELLLSQARKKIDGEKQTAKESLATPEAVYKHLPPSQRLEYIRLKQKIAERERLKMRILEGKKESSGDSGVVPPPGLEAANASNVSVKESTEKSKPGDFPRANVKSFKSPNEDSSRVKSTELSWSKPGFGRNSPSICKSGGVVASANETTKKDPSECLNNNKLKNNLVGFCGKGLKKSVAPPGNGLKAAAPIQRSSLLLPSSQALISKLKLLLKKIKVEKMIEENYGKEISKLRSQLSLFERKQSEQRFKIKKLGEESMKTYKAIQGITAKSNEKAARKENEVKEKTEDGEGPKEEGKKPEEGKNVSDEPVTEITKTEGKTDIEPNGDVKLKEACAIGTTLATRVLEYNSPLQVFNKVDSSKRVDPNVMMCQFDLMGVCKDEECTYQHLRNS